MGIKSNNLTAYTITIFYFCDITILKIYFENGRIAENGNHETLMSQNGVYKKMYLLQAEKYKF